MLDKFRYQASQFPDRIAIKSDNLSLSYGELWQQVSAIASSIQSQGFKDQCIGISLKNKTHELISCIGTLLSNNHFFFIPEEIQDNWWEQVPVSLLITDQDHLRKAEFPSIEFYDLNKRQVAQLDPWWEQEAVENKLFCIYCTSGSTSNSKYVVHDYQAIMEDTYRQVEENNIHASDTLDFLFAASFSSSLASIFPAIISGASIAVFDLASSNLKEIPLFWQKHQVTFATMTSSSFRTLARISSINLLEYTHSIRFLCLGGEPVLKSDLQLFGASFPKDSEIQLAYASTETRTLSQIRIGHNTQLALIHDGFPVRNKTIKILDELGMDCADEKEGEVVIHSPFISLGYYIKGSLNPHEKVGSNRIYRTGDRGFFSREGSIQLTGRVQSLQKVNGKWIDLTNLEKRICQVSLCENCKILINKDENGFEYLVACLEVNKIDPDTSVYLSLNGQIKSEILPRSYIQFKNFPLTANGKIDSNKMLELVKEQEFSTVSEQIDCLKTLQIHQIWCDHLGVSIANLDADFFTELGGSSLLSVLVVDEIAQKLHQKIDTHALFQYRTIRKLAHFLKNEKEEQPLPCIHWISSEPKKDLPNFFFIETGHYYSYQTILKKPISSDYFNLAYLRIDQFKVLQGFHADSILEELVDLLKPYPKPVLLATSFNGFVAAKLNQHIGGALILIDSPWYEKEKIGYFSLQNRLTAMYHRFRSLSIRRAFIQAGAQAIGYSLKKINLKKEDINPFEKSIQLFISQSRPVEQISHLLYFYSTKSVITSSKDVKHWSKVTDESYLYVDIVGDHLDALSESNSDLVLQKINEFLLRVYY